MLFLAQWTIRPEHRDRAIERFKQSGGPPPSSVKVIGRWHTIGQSGGLLFAEAKDSLVMGQWCMGWSDIFSFDIKPVVDDDDLLKILDPAAHPS